MTSLQELSLLLASQFQRNYRACFIMMLDDQMALHLSHDRQVQESSAKLTNQRVSYAFTSSPFSFHARHILPTSKYQHSYSCISLIFYRHQ